MQTVTNKHGRLIQTKNYTRCLLQLSLNSTVSNFGECVCGIEPRLLLLLLSCFSSVRVVECNKPCLGEWRSRSCK